VNLLLGDACLEEAALPGMTSFRSRYSGQDVPHSELGTPVCRINANIWSVRAPAVTIAVEKRAQWSARARKLVVKCSLYSKARTTQCCHLTFGGVDKSYLWLFSCSFVFLLKGQNADVLGAR